ncbi:transposase [Halomonas salinarum]
MISSHCPAFFGQAVSEPQCRTVLPSHRWPKGFLCSECGNTNGR